MGAHARLKLIALGGEVGENSGQLSEQALGGGERRFRLGDAFIDAAALSTRDLISSFNSVSSASSRCSATSGVGGLLLLAGDIGRKLRQPAIEFGDALLGALFLAVERFARIGEPLQSGGGAGFGLAQRRQFGGAHRLDTGRLGLFAGAFGHVANAEVVGAGGFRHVGIGLQPAQMEQHGLGLAHLGGDFAVADRLPRLLLQAVDLSGQLPDHVLDAGEVGFGGLRGAIRPRGGGREARRRRRRLPARGGAVPVWPG